jgi:predicted phosphodiesterase
LGLNSKAREEVISVAVAIISDIHGDIESLREAADIIKTRNVKKVICLGDVFAEGVNNDAILDILFGLNCTFILGNHDYEAYVERTPNVDRYFKESMESLSIGYLHFTHYIDREPYTPVTESYQAWNIFDEYDWSHVFIGHNQRAALFVHNPNKTGDCEYREGYGKKFKVALNNRVIVSVGSITPGRDHRSRRSFVIYENKSSTYEFITF